MFTAPIDWNKIIQQLQQDNLAQLNGSITNGQHPQQPLFNPIQPLVPNQPINSNQGNTGGPPSNSHPVPPTDLLNLTLPQNKSAAWYASNTLQSLTQTSVSQNFHLNQEMMEVTNLNVLINPRSSETFQNVLPPPPAHIGCCVKLSPKKSTQLSDIAPSRTKEHSPIAQCPFNNFPYGTGIFPGVVPPIERDLEYANEKHLMSSIPWFPSPPAAHSTPHHPPKLEVTHSRGPPPTAHSGFLTDS
nr:hypothetical protein HmN_000697900 [Hymenolepis microstoma]